MLRMTVKQRRGRQGLPVLWPLLRLPLCHFAHALPVAPHILHCTVVTPAYALLRGLRLLAYDKAPAVRIDARATCICTARDTPLPRCVRDAVHFHLRRLYRHAARASTYPRFAKAGASRDRHI